MIIMKAFFDRDSMAAGIRKIAKACSQNFEKLSSEGGSGKNNSWLEATPTIIINYLRGRGVFHSNPYRQRNE